MTARQDAAAKRQECEHDWEDTEYIFSEVGLLLFPTAQRCKKCGVRIEMKPI